MQELIQDIHQVKIYELIEDKAYLQSEWWEENCTSFIEPYIFNHFAESSFEHQINVMFNNLWFTKAVIEDDNMSVDEKVDELVGEVERGKSKIIMVVGARDAGKTYAGLWLAEQVREKGGWNTIYYVGHPTAKELYPSWFRFVTDLDELPSPCFAIIDESAIRYNARRAMTDLNVEFGNRLRVLRHDGMSFVLLTQNIKMVEIDADRLADIIIYKPGTTYGIRKQKDELLGKFWEEQLMIINRLKPGTKAEFMVEYRRGSRRIFRSAENPKPSFMTPENEDRISKSYKGQINIMHKEKETKIQEGNLESPESITGVS